MKRTNPSRSELIRLLVGCPHSLIFDPNPEECPLFELRRRPLADRMRWAQERAPDVVDQILDYHGWCSARKTLEEITAKCWRAAPRCRRAAHVEKVTARE